MYSDLGYMKIFTSDQIRAADSYTIANEPIASIDLMERAALQIADWINSRFSKTIRFKVFIGPGNNGGDAWALLRILSARGYTDIAGYLLKITDKISADSEINKKRLLNESHIQVHDILSISDFPVIDEDDCIVDGLFGSGLSRPLTGLSAELVKYINEKQKKCLIAIDLPSGLFCDENTLNIGENIIKADHTLSFEFPRLSFFFAENAEYLGDWHILPIMIHPDFIQNEKTDYNFISEEDVLFRLRLRKKFSHKGTYGHALLIAGSYGMMGAAVLASKAAVRAGAGLVTTHIPGKGVDILQSSVPESLLHIDQSDEYFSDFPTLQKYSAVGVGPGLNKMDVSRESLMRLLNECKIPLIIDADALNMLSETTNWQKKIPKGCILTPHPKEFERLFGKFHHSHSRLSAQISFSKEFHSTVILKGAHTCITTEKSEVWFNTTGNPGMATGGSGDVLTGIILGLVAQGYSTADASIIGVYLHGMSGDIAAKQKGQHGLIASDLIDNIGYAFSVLENKKAVL